MQKSAVIILTAALLVLLVAASVLISGCSSVFSSGDGGVTSLSAVEVRSYEGEKLSPVNAFRENSIRGPQQVNISNYRLTIGGLVKNPRVYTYDEVLGHFPQYSKVVTLYCVEGWDATILWEGVLVRDLVLDAGADSRATTIIFTARDGYTTSFPLAYVMENDILMAYRMNNVTLPVERGYPFQLVAEDKWGYKWIKWIEKIELSDNAAYRGYWEQRGYSDAADLDKSFYSR